uniref:Uncharacterized protein n=1 Tax=Anguilla anguilla TaxID=7936 RepID=A0A0E9S6J7_ANGAN
MQKLEGSSLKKRTKMMI